MISKRLISKLQLLIRDARKAGIAISTTELEDALSTLVLVPPEEWELLTMFTATMVKTQEEQRLFRQLMRLHLGIGEPLLYPVNQDSDTGCGSNCCSGAGTGSGQGGIGGAPNSLAFLQALLKQGNPSSQKTYLTQLLTRLEDQLDWQQPEQQLLNQVMLALNYREARYYLRRQEPDNPEIERALREFEVLLEEEIEYRKLRNADTSQRELWLEYKDLSKADFGQLSLQQEELVGKCVQKLGRSLANRHSRRYKRAQKGKIDFVATLRSSCGSGGIPFRLRYKAHKKDKPCLVILCDLSGSVAPYARFILLLIYQLQQLFTQIRTFAFVDSVSEISRSLKESSSTSHAIRAILSNPTYNKTGFSHYGTVIEEFLNKYTNVGGRGHKLIVIGDGRSNYQRVFPELWQQAFAGYQQVYWLNPLPKEQWNQGDCMAEAIFAPMVAQMYECRNLKQLERVTKEIV